MTPQVDNNSLNSKHVVILMASYNGEQHLSAQLESFVVQEHTNWSLIVSDDGSTDSTLQILEAFAETNPDHKVTLIPGPRKGPAANFMNLLSRVANLAPEGSFIALSDQDDVWLPHRLSQGIRALLPLADAASAWCSRTIITESDLTIRRISVPRTQSLCFRNALVQNVMSGNTILLNPAAAQLASRLAAQREGSPVVFHDWWLYLILTGTGATVLHDDRPCLYYRQHENNIVGASDSQLERLMRIKMLLSGRFRYWNKINLAALAQVRTHLTTENAILLDLFNRVHNGNFLERLSALRRAGLFRQTKKSTIAVWFAVAFRLF